MEKVDQPEGFSYESPEKLKKSGAKILIIETAAVIIAIAAILTILNMMGIISVSNFLNPPDKNLAVINSKISPTPISFKPLKVFRCPVEDAACSEAKSVTFQGSPALLLSVASGSSIKPISFYVQQSKPYSLDGLTGLVQSFIYNSRCYTASYLFSKDSIIESVGEGPFEGEIGLATAGKSQIEVNGTTGNVLVQLQVRDLDSPLEVKKEAKSCDLNITKNRYGNFEALNSEYFKLQP